jgi:hypothetical protein
MAPWPLPLEAMVNKSGELAAADSFALPADTP